MIAPAAVSQRRNGTTIIDEPPPSDRLGTERDGAARHGVAAPRGQSPRPGARDGHFTRLFEQLAPCDPGDAAIEALATHMRVRSGSQSLNNGDVPAGFTYLGQFVDHDITFDATSQLLHRNDPLSLANFRTARLDLDSLYGSGPIDQPFLYDWRHPTLPGVKLLLGANPACRGYAAVDLQRNAQDRALVGDPRNDENLVISQLHLLFLRFHNRVVDDLCRDHPEFTSVETFVEAQRIVRWHYQWIVVHDLLRRIVGPTTAADVLPDLDVVEPAISVASSRRRLYRFEGGPQIPVEFSAAAYRFGHSMVRASYVMSTLHGDPAKLFPDLGGLQRLPEIREIEWKLFFGGAPERMQSLRIDDRLSEPLFHLPGDHKPLAQLNLKRGVALGLPSGNDVALALGQTPLTRAELFPEEQPRELEALLRATPLWFYLLREAHVRGHHGQQLGPIGGRIVAEVLVGLLEGDPDSYLSRQPAWEPELRRAAAGDFTIEDLLRYTLQDESSWPLPSP